MKKDFELIRLILLDIEKNQTLNNRMYQPIVEGFTQDQIDTQISIIAGDLIEVKDRSNKCITNFYVQGITDKGYEFIKAVKDDTLWKKTSNWLIENGKEFTRDLIIATASNFLSGKLV
jgi:hypothetical protein